MLYIPSTSEDAAHLVQTAEAVPALQHGSHFRNEPLELGRTRQPQHGTLSIAWEVPVIQGTRKAGALAGLDVLAVRECGSASDHAHARASHTVGAPALSGTHWSLLSTRSATFLSASSLSICPPKKASWTETM